MTQLMMLLIAVLIGSLLLAAGTVTTRRRSDRSNREALAALTEQLELELDRARRHQYPVAVVAIRVPPSAEHRRRDPFAELAVRRSDLAFHGRDVLYVLVPQSGRRGARQLTVRLLATLTVATGLQVTIACFPQDALTVGGLLERLDARGASSDPWAVGS